MTAAIHQGAMQSTPPSLTSPSNSSSDKDELDHHHHLVMKSLAERSPSPTTYLCLLMCLVAPHLVHVAFEGSLLSGSVLMWSSLAPIGALTLLSDSTSWIVAFFACHFVSVSLCSYLHDISISSSLSSVAPILAFTLVIFFLLKRSKSSFANTDTLAEGHEHVICEDEPKSCNKSKRFLCGSDGAPSRAELSIEIMQKMSAELKKTNNKLATEVDFVITTLAGGDLYSLDMSKILSTSPHTDKEVDSTLQDFIIDHMHSHQTRVGASPRSEHRYRPNHSTEKFCNVTCPEADPLLDNVCDWNFDIFELDRVTKGRPIFFMGQALFRHHNLVEKFNIDRHHLHHFLEAVEEGYNRSNAYHNNIHATDVAQTLNFFLTKGNIAKDLTYLDIFAAIVAALIHDIDHPGVNNNFEIMTGSPRALMYNDVSVLESHHCSTAFKILKREDCDIFSGVSNEDRKVLRLTIIEMVLATDFSKHLEIVGQFNSRRAAGGFNREVTDHRMLLLKMAIKCADISHTMKGRDLHLNWTDRVVQEFYNQGDREKAAGLPISAFMDREKPNIPKSQFGFINFLVAPMIDSFAQEFPSTKICFDQLESNLNHWKSQMS